MPQVRDFLDRFRPAGAPGAAARAGIPADRARELAAELGPVLALLDNVQAECAEIIDAATHEADLIVEQAQAEAARITADGERRARSARDEAAAQALAEAGAEARRAIAAARREAATVRKLAVVRMPGLVARAVELARAGPDGLPGPAAGEPGRAAERPR